MPDRYSLVRLPWEVQGKAWLVAETLYKPADPFDGTGIVAAIETALDAYLEKLGMEAEGEETAPD